MKSPYLMLHGLTCPECDGHPPPVHGELGGCPRCGRAGEVSVRLSLADLRGWLVFGIVPAPPEWPETDIASTDGEAWWPSS